MLGEIEQTVSLIPRAFTGAQSLRVFAPRHRPARAGEIIRNWRIAGFGTS